MQLLRGALIVDGVLSPAWTGDLLFDASGILEIGPDLSGRVGSHVPRRDCQGLALAPGFIDVHTHDDAALLLDPAMAPKLSQGVTTVVVGNCGISLVPLRLAPGQAPVPPLNLLPAETYRYARFADYRAALEAAQPAVNVLALVGHTALRAACMPELDRPARPAELAAMCALLDQALAEGAGGLSSGTFYAPAAAAPPEELLALARVAARHSGRIYATHLRDEMAGVLAAIEEAADTAHQAGLPLQISHHKCAGHRQWGRAIETLALIERLAQRQDLGLDVYPYLAGSTVLREDLVDGHTPIRLTWSEPHPERSGQWLAEVASEWGVTEVEACRRLQPGGACYFQMCEDDVDRILAHSLAMIGSDGLPHDRQPHPRLWGAFPRVLAHYSRERGLLSLERAVHKMSGQSAQRFGLLHERGLLRPGAAADLLLFDPAAVQDLADYGEPCRPARGIEAVWVNGQLALEGGVGRARAGRVLSPCASRAAGASSS
ncbi:N-acyl-D-amino-acid deacylase family protein [Kinneretia aquatilis]|uniref:N-acyl-D-amino-acid deacylase family protein n=1 Tax=Kinneretia aquatilis TaxID=2070761 RepID=UPI0014953356|nr:D-aminoacylase [Paucibacter aquatile]WIV98015.1 D-aminoacylase [Paucibacter aquatile]